MVNDMGNVHDVMFTEENGQQNYIYSYYIPAHKKVRQKVNSGFSLGDAVLSEFYFLLETSIFKKFSTMNLLL